MSSEEEKNKQQKKDNMRDRMNRPEPREDITEGDEDTIDESLRQKEQREQKKRTA